jgi:hypothetical protein
VNLAESRGGLSAGEDETRGRADGVAGEESPPPKTICQPMPSEFIAKAMNPPKASPAAMPAQFRTCPSLPQAVGAAPAAASMQTRAWPSGLGERRRCPIC